MCTLQSKLELSVSWLQFICHLFDLEKPLSLAACYFSPAGSVRLSRGSIGERCSCLRALLSATKCLGQAMLCGDFSAPWFGVPLSSVGLSRHARQVVELCLELDTQMCTGIVAGDIPASPSFGARYSVELTFKGVSGAQPSVQQCEGGSISVSAPEMGP